MKWRVDLNCDLGEGGAHDEALLELVSSANIACGVHAGSPEIMRRTVRWALARGVGIGAHPGLAGGMGRTEQALDAAGAYSLVVEQVTALQDIARYEGAKLQHVKAHGALYNMAARDAELANAVARAVRAVDAGLILVGLAGSALIAAGHAAGLPVAAEAFADRGYRADGQLVPRGQAGALIEDPPAAAVRAVRMIKERRVETVAGAFWPVRADTLCVHGDSPGALETLRQLRELLVREQIEVRGL